MSGICGWIDHRPDDRAGSTLLDMAGFLDGDSSKTDTRTAGGVAVAARVGNVPAGIHEESSLTIAALGRILWRLPELDVIARERGPAAALANAYLEHGPDCLKHIGGNFALAILDARRATGLLAIDRMGIRTLCYANPAGSLIFASTADSVATHPRIERQPSAQAIFNYLYYHMVPSPGTIYQGIHKLQPGECVIFSNGSIERRFYWQLRYRDERADTVDALGHRFRQLLRQAVAQSVDGESRVGAFLSGGTDSSTVTGLLAEIGERPAKTYSIGFSVDGFDEMEYARITARHFSTEAHEYYLTPSDVVDAIPVIARAYDEPFANASAVPTFYCAKMAESDGTRVVLAGDGGDEIFGGNARYAKQKVFELYGIVPPHLRRYVIGPMISAWPDDSTMALLQKLKSYIRQASIPLPDRLESYNLLHRTPLADTLERDFAAQVDISEPVRLLREVYGRTGSSSAVNRMMNLDLKIALADNDLRKVSRMCEVAGVEVRYPLLDDALVDFSGEIPAQLKVKGLRLRHFFKQALKDFLPPETLAKTKHGFGMPFGVWLQHHKPLADLARESLSAFQRRQILRPAYLASLLRQHESTHATYFGTMIWVIMMLERWLDERRM